jgi:ketosteroid isomerase-like protein
VGEVDWSGHHTEGSLFAMRGVIIATIRDDRIAAGRLYIEPVEHNGADIEAAVEQLYRPPLESN